MHVMMCRWFGRLEFFMLFLTAILLAAGFAWFCAKPLREKPVPFYIGAGVLSAGMYALGQIPALRETTVLKFTVDLFASSNRTKYKCH